MELHAAEIMYHTTDAGMAKLQDLAPAIVLLSGVVNDTALSAMAAAAKNENSINMISESLTTAISQTGNAVKENANMTKMAIDANTKAISAAADDMTAWREKYARASDDGLELRAGSDLGHVIVTASEIDLQGSVQLLDRAGDMVNINNLPADVSQLQSQMDGMFGTMSTSVVSMMEELKDLRSRCTPLAEWEQVPLTSSTDRMCRPLTEVCLIKGRNAKVSLRHLFSGYHSLTHLPFFL